jgi:hypothetical protein
MSNSAHTILLVLAFVLFVLAAVKVPSDSRVSLGWFGLAALALAFLIV